MTTGLITYNQIKLKGEIAIFPHNKKGEKSMSIREKIYTYYFYNYARMDYNLIAETENEEKIYYNPEYGKIVVFVEDK